jgi:hypothetical protein
LAMVGRRYTTALHHRISNTWFRRVDHAAIFPLIGQPHAFRSSRLLKKALIAPDSGGTMAF